MTQLCKDLEGNYVEVNKQLERMGYNIGLRLIEDFLAKSNTGRCSNFKETAEVISKVSVNRTSCCYCRSADMSLPDWLQDVLEHHA